MFSNRWTKDGNKCQSPETRLQVTFCCGTAKCFPTLARCAASSRRHPGFVLGLIRPATLPSAAHKRWVQPCLSPGLPRVLLCAVFGIDWWQMEHDGAHKPRSLACSALSTIPAPRWHRSSLRVSLVRTFVFCRGPSRCGRADSASQPVRPRSMALRCQRFPR